MSYLLKGKAEAAQQTNPVESRATSSAMYRRCCGGTCRRFQQSDVVIMVQRRDSKAGGFRDWPEPDRPEDFQAALDDAADISELEKSITLMARWEWVRWINATKNLQTRERRVEVGISKLRSGRRQCCFDLTACTDPDLSKNGLLAEVT